jgi:uncharacterized protein
MSARWSGRMLAPMTTIFRTALAIALLHAVDDGLLSPGYGVPAGQHLAALLFALAAAAAGWFLYPRMRPGMQAFTAGAYGLPALVNGAMHVAHVPMDGLAREDVTGIAAAGAGLVLLGLAAATPFVRRGARATDWVRRWRNRVVAVIGGFIVASLTVIPVSYAIWDTHKPRGDVGSPPSAAWRSVAFDSTDGLRLRGWFRPSRNGSTVLVVHGGGGDRTGAMRHARMLERNGFGVLVYDARGRGESEGQPNSWGWDWEKDALGAMRFLRARPDVAPGRIAALGLSSGGDTVLDLAARDHGLRAAVADGAALRTYEDQRRQFGTSPGSIVAQISLKAVHLWSGQAPSRPLGDVVRDITAPTLLISAGTNAERDFNRTYAAEAPEHLTHWNLPNAAHTGALRRSPVLYEHRVVGFLRRALGV